MKVSQVTIYMVADSRFQDVQAVEGSDISDLHFITRDGTLGYNFIQDGRRKGRILSTDASEMASDHLSHWLRRSGSGLADSKRSVSLKRASKRTSAGPLKLVRRDSSCIRFTRIKTLNSTRSRQAGCRD